MSLQGARTATAPPPAAPRAVSPHGPLSAVAIVTMLGFVLALIGVFVDHRTFGGAPVWLKPLKFTISFGLYAATLAWLLPQVTRWRRAGWWAGTMLSAALLLELSCISFQASRGVASHFNTVTATDATVIQIMTLGVFVLYLGNLVLILVLMRGSFLNPELRWAFRLGLVLALAGMVEGFFMNVPTAEQTATAKAGVPTLLGAHTVGAPDGGPGLPVTGWSTVGGDLRIPHFVALHALQVLPLLVLLITAASRRLPSLRGSAVRVRLVVVAAVTYAGLFVLLIWQAVRAQPLIRPDALTLGGLGLLVLLAVTGTTLAIGTGRATRSDD
jgi:hypothetical protein